MTSKAFTKFHKTVRRCDTLVDAYTTLHSLNAADASVPTAPKDIIRGAIVLAVAALDAYVTDVFVEKLATYLKKYRADDSLVDLLLKAGLDTREALTLLTRERPYRRIRNLVRSYYSQYTTQRFDVIDSVFLVYRLNKLTDSAARKSGRSHIQSRVGELIDRRHEIVHAGDYNQANRIQDIDEVRVKRWITALEYFVSAMDEIICNRIPTPIARQIQVAVAAEDVEDVAPENREDDAVGPVLGEEGDD
ncbi:HEPN domain-containing protein [Pseudomonas sp. M20]|uniref:HEPN domain-containing protein n=1 Tax=Pseudomonas sp. M20 TaxID=3379129 RepID=UPI0038685F5D